MSMVPVYSTSHLLLPCAGNYLIEDRIVNQGTTGPLNLELNILPHSKL